MLTPTEMLRKVGTENLSLTFIRCKMLVMLKKIISVNGCSVTVRLGTNRMEEGEAMSIEGSLKPFEADNEMKTGKNYGVFLKDEY